MTMPANAAKFSPAADMPVEVKPLRTAVKTLLITAAILVAGVLVWQGVTAAGNPDPTLPNTSRMGAIMDVGVLVFREGLECILVLAAITASMTGEKQAHRRPVAAGAGIAFLATVVTWFVAVGILHDLGNDVSALNLQAATGLLAVVVLLVVMNWFFHKIYWGGWITLHNRRKKELLTQVQERPETVSYNKLWWGLALLGFASLYREGFEVVLFLQGYYLKMGSGTVLLGALVGLGLSGVVAVLTFVGQRRLPYRKMLIFTGVLLGIVLLVMVGEQAQEMQLAHWLPTTNIARLQPLVPDWAGVWFSIFPTVETLAAQGLAAVLVVGSYFASRKLARV
ncbi:MAG TPA: FTR1 family protein [Chthoniobacteraceae bacterium]|jgi:high-affinity iron transporter|nr:FTR1 family protein [Chthoniobacteraceae bacterium]